MGRLLSQCLPILSRRHPGSSPEGAGEARLRSESCVQRNLVQRCASGHDHGFGIVEPPLADIAMRRHSHRCSERAAKVKDAKTCDFGQVANGDVVDQVHVDIFENTLQSSGIQAMATPRLRLSERRLEVRVGERAARNREEVSTSMRPAAVGCIISESTVCAT